MRTFYLLIMMGLWLTGCDEPPTGERPLRPLVYTEHPEITPEAAAVRERRIMRELVEGVRSRAATEEKATPRAPRTTPESLATDLVDALLNRDAATWDSLFVSPTSYAGLVHVEPAKARDFVDEIQGASSSAWEIFEPAAAAESVPGGLPTLFSFDSIQLGEPRGMDGKVVEDESLAVQHWNNIVVLAFGDKAKFELRIAKILRVGAGVGVREFVVGSKITGDPALHVLMGAGIHLKPEMLRSDEYPIPLQVGTFWRYRRQSSDAVVDPLALPDPAGKVAIANSVIVEVVSVDRFGTMRLVKLHRSYDDADLTKVTQWWLVTPRRVDLCDRACRKNVEDLVWILSYLKKSTPIFVFPLRAEGWKGFTTRSVETVEVPGGVFSSVVAIQGRGSLGLFDSRLNTTQTRFFATGQGIVRREIGPPGDSQVIEELVEHRIMP